MTDDQWKNNPWDDQKHREGSGEQDESLDSTTIRPRAEAAPESSASADHAGGQQESQGAEGQSASGGTWGGAYSAQDQ
ncbi:MAG: hypothetical protein L0K74_14425, partial [Acidipropionibacterium acidipropionici]|nr:hypothetical protein [Acidipropionibacterium acidipropionici]